jgi:predicted small secreted protein
MSEKMSSTLTGLAVGASLVAGVALGAGSMKVYRDKKKVSTASILENVKASFRAESEIQVSYIEEEVETMVRFALENEVYRGAIITIESGQHIAYEFLADAHTGTVISLDRKEVTE